MWAMRNDSGFSSCGCRQGMAGKSSRSFSRLIAKKQCQRRWNRFLSIRRRRVLVFVLAGRLRERGSVDANGSGLSFGWGAGKVLQRGPRLSVHSHEVRRCRFGSVKIPLTEISDHYGRAHSRLGSFPTRKFCRMNRDGSAVNLTSGVSLCRRVPRAKPGSG